jgi:hypothetical protein
MVINYKLSTIKSFYHKASDFAMVLVFKFFCHSSKKIARETKEKEIKECVLSVNM